MENSYNIIRIQQYIAGQLAKEEMYELEREAMDDPFLNDALEGYRLQKEVNHGKLSLLQQRLATRIEGQQVDRSRFYFTSQRLAIAATAAVLFVLAVVLLWMRATVTETSTEPVLVQTQEIFVDSRLSLIGSGPAVDGQSGAFLQDLNRALQDELNWLLLREAAQDGGHYVVDFEIGADARPTQVEVWLFSAEGTTGSGTEKAPAVVESELQRVLQSGPQWDAAPGTTGSLELQFTVPEG